MVQLENVKKRILQKISKAENNMNDYKKNFEKILINFQKIFLLLLYKR